jgi:hypothetical protein
MSTIWTDGRLFRILAVSQPLLFDVFNLLHANMRALWNSAIGPHKPCVHKRRRLTPASRNIPIQVRPWRWMTWAPQSLWSDPWRRGHWRHLAYVTRTSDLAVQWYFANHWYSSALRSLLQSPTNWFYSTYSRCLMVGLFRHPKTRVQVHWEIILALTDGVCLIQ